MSTSAKIVNTETKSFAAEKVRKEVDALIEQGHKADEHYASGRKQTYFQIGKIVGFTLSLLNDEELMDAAYALAGGHNIPIPKPGDNFALMIVRLTCGRFNEDKWSPDRSAEHYAPVVRHFIAIQTPPEEIQDILVNQRDISDGKGKGGTIKATLANIKTADRALHQTNNRTPVVFTDEAKEAAEKLKPLYECKSSDALKKSFTFSEGYALAIVRWQGDKLVLLGDSGKTGNEVLRVVKMRTPELAKLQGPAEDHKRDIASIRASMGLSLKSAA